MGGAVVVRQARRCPGIASLGTLLLLASPLTLGAQERVTTWSTTTTVERVSSAADSVYARAARLVSVGQGAEGRALMDSMVAALPPGSATNADALFWRATLAATTTAAERDYRVVTVEYALSPRAPEAMLRLAQLELARGDRPAALRYLERIAREHAGSATRPRAQYWAGRVHLEAADSARACESFASARGAARGDDGALRSQLDEYTGVCRGRGGATTRVATAAPTPAPASVTPAVSAPVPASVTPPVSAPVTPTSIEAAFGGVATPVRTLPSGDSTRGGPPAGKNAAAPAPERDRSVAGSAPTPVNVPPPRDSARGGPPAGKVTATPAPVRDRSTAAGAETPPPPVVVVRQPTITPPVVTPPVVTPPLARTGWAVQIAAYDTESPARALAARLTSRGTPTVVRGTVAPFRVRVGPYTTRAQAVAAAARLRTAGQTNAFIVADTATQAGAAAP